MKKMHHRNIYCYVIAEEFTFRSEVPCSYDKDTIAYAVERFLPRCTRLCKECTQESWQIRIAKGKGRKARKFSYLVPSVLMELPGGWVRISGNIDALHVNVKKVEILRDHPCFTMRR